MMLFSLLEFHLYWQIYENKAGKGQIGANRPLAYRKADSDYAGG